MTLKEIFLQFIHQSQRIYCTDLTWYVKVQAITLKLPLFLSLLYITHTHTQTHNKRKNIQVITGNAVLPYLNGKWTQQTNVLCYNRPVYVHESTGRTFQYYAGRGGYSQRYGGPYSTFLYVGVRSARRSLFSFFLCLFFYCIINEADLFTTHKTDFMSWDPAIRGDLNAMVYFPTSFSKWIYLDPIAMAFSSSTNIEVKRSVDIVPCVVSSSALSTSCSYGSGQYCPKGGWYKVSNQCLPNECIIPLTFSNGMSSSHDVGAPISLSLSLSLSLFLITHTLTHSLTHSLKSTYR